MTTALRKLLSPVWSIFSYLISGRDLLRFQSSNNKASAPVVLADIDYNNQGKTVASAKSPGSRGSQNRRSGDFANLEFDSLPATKEEAAAGTTAINQ
ncbi:hypothetical protein [Nostoc sp. PCC 7107]|uniref:hypothetical protein n=1 Tax=Nostoc sp. PCC 7107 TaxID=317936 RepID=UPI0002D63BA4|nr:hypothetical protein [Nostoc sp. PCC 7107]